MTIRTLGVLALTFVLPSCRSPAESRGPAPVATESVFFLVRHAEKVDQSEGSPLTEGGQRRAEALARLLKDAGVERIYSSDFRRTRDTAAPLARERGLEVVLYDPDDLAGLADTLLSSSGRSLVVGHSDTTPELVRRLGGEPVSAIAETEYDRLYMLYSRKGSGTSTVLLRLPSHAGGVELLHHDSRAQTPEP